MRFHFALALGVLYPIAASSAESVRKIDIKKEIDLVAAREGCEKPNYEHAISASFFSERPPIQALIFSCRSSKGEPMVVVSEPLNQLCPAKIHVEADFELETRPTKQAFLDIEHFEYVVGIRSTEVTGPTSGDSSRLTGTALIVCKGEDCGLETVLVCHRGKWHQENRD